MAVDERSRHAMHNRLEELMGAEDAATLMEHLPPVGWADVATKGDIQLMKRELDLMKRELEASMHHLEGTLRLEIAQAMRLVVLTNIASVIGAAGLAFAAASL